MQILSAPAKFKSVVSPRRAGWSYEAIAKTLGISYGSAYNWAKDIINSDNIDSAETRQDSEGRARPLSYNTADRPASVFAGTSQKAAARSSTIQKTCRCKKFVFPTRSRYSLHPGARGVVSRVVDFLADASFSTQARGGVQNLTPIGVILPAVSPRRAGVCGLVNFPNWGNIALTRVLFLQERPARGDRLSCGLLHHGDGHGPRAGRGWRGMKLVCTGSYQV